MMSTRNAFLPGFEALQRDLRRLIENADETATEQRNTWSPRTDVVEFEDRFELQMDLPGVNREDISMSFERDTLEISGERKAEKSGESGAFYRCECAMGPFSRRFRFPSLVSASNITAKMENGVLVVAVPKAEEAKPRSIDIK